MVLVNLRLTVYCLSSLVFPSPFVLGQARAPGRTPSCRVLCKEGFCVSRGPYREEARFCVSILGSCVASAVRLPRLKLGIQVCDLEKVIGPFSASVFSLVNRKENDLPPWIVLKITYNMLSKQMANVTYNY